MHFFLKLGHGLLNLGNLRGGTPVCLCTSPWGDSVAIISPSQSYSLPMKRSVRAYVRGGLTVDDTEARRRGGHGERSWRETSGNNTGRGIYR